ncbi:hypothetical protein BDY21DRAFT_407130, partial [Lineolata rhizophorae]
GQQALHPAASPADPRAALLLHQPTLAPDPLDPHPAVHLRAQLVQAGGLPVRARQSQLAARQGGVEPGVAAPRVAAAPPMLLGRQRRRRRRRQQPAAVALRALAARVARPGARLVAHGRPAPGPGRLSELPGRVLAVVVHVLGEEPRRVYLLPGLREVLPEVWRRPGRRPVNEPARRPKHRNLAGPRPLP